MTTALIVRTNGDIEDYNGELSFASIYPLLDVSTIQYIFNLEGGMIAMIDEEGEINNSVGNLSASLVLHELGFPVGASASGGLIKGNVLFFGGVDGEVEAPLTEAQETRIRSILNLDTVR